MNHTQTTLGELLSHTNETIKRNAMSILKTLQKQKNICERHPIKTMGNCKKCLELKKKNCPHYINSDPKYNPNGYMYCTQCK